MEGEDHLPQEDFTLPSRFVAILDAGRQSFRSSKDTITSFHGFGSFHSDNVEDLIHMTEAEYKVPAIPPIGRRILPKSVIKMLFSSLSEAHGDGEHPEVLSKRFKAEDGKICAKDCETRCSSTVKSPGTEGSPHDEMTIDSISCTKQLNEKMLLELISSPIPLCSFGSAFREEFFQITQSKVFINHGAFGSALYGAMVMKHEYERRAESEIVEFVDRNLLPLLVYTIRRLSKFLAACCRNVVLVQNATFGLNSAVKLIGKDDIVAYLDSEYLAVYKVLWFRCKEVGAQLHEIGVHKYLHDARMKSDSGITGIICSQLPAGCTTLVIDHVTSTSALCYPIFSHIIPAVRKCGVTKIIVDGAHAPLQLDLNFDSLQEAAQPTVYAGNLHKWCCAPKGVGFLWVQGKWASQLTSAVRSHGAGEGLVSEFIWDGTKDYGAHLCVPAILDFWESQDLPRIRCYCVNLLQRAASMLTEAFGSRPLARHSPFMSLIELPETLQDKDMTAKYIQDALYQHFHVEVPIKQVEGRLYLRISAFVYNTLEEYVYLKEAILSIAQNVSDLRDRCGRDAASSASTSVPATKKCDGCGIGALTPSSRGAKF